jgi:hypothetical protein
MLKTQRKRYFRNLLHQKLDEMAEKTDCSRMNRDIKGMRNCAMPSVITNPTTPPVKDHP